MFSIGDLLEEIIFESKGMLLTEAVTKDQVNTALDSHKRVRIFYQGEKETKPALRYVDIYAYGVSMAGNEVIRVFQPFGFTTTEYGWKLMRLDRISRWEPTNAYIWYKAIEKNPLIPKRNPNGDDSMSVVYNVAKFIRKRYKPKKQQTPSTAGNADIDIINSVMGTDNSNNTNNNTNNNNQQPSDYDSNAKI